MIILSQIEKISLFILVHIGVMWLRIFLKYTGMQEDELKLLLDGQHTFAIIGASNNEEKYGYKIFKQLKQLGFKVYPVNPREDEVQGEKAYENMLELPEKVDVLNFVVPPEVSKKITENALNAGYKIFWYQPGSFDSEVLRLHETKDTQVISDRCLLIESGSLK